MLGTVSATPVAPKQFTVPSLRATQLRFASDAMATALVTPGTDIRIVFCQQVTV
jgi:hypothetical protein